MSAVLVLCNKVRVGRGGDEWLMDDGTNGLANFFEMLQKLCGAGKSDLLFVN
jgi:hypothetical protein